MELTKYLIGIPCMDTMPLPFVASLTYMQRVGASRVTFLSNSLVYQARNMIAAEAIDTGADRVLWLDSDMQFDVDLMQRLAADVDDGMDYVSALCFKRRVPIAPILCKAIEPVEEDGQTQYKQQTYLDYPRDTLFEVAATGFGAVMCSTKMLKDVWDAFGEPFTHVPGMGEDYSFCYRAKQLGYKLYCDSRIKVGHVGLLAYGEDHYIRQREMQDDATRLQRPQTHE